MTKISQTFSILSLAILLFSFCVGPADAAKYNTAINVGDPAPHWSGLMGVDGKTNNFDDLADAKAVVIVFTCNQCPVAQAYEDRLNDLVKKYKDKGVAVVAINPNSTENIDQMKQRAEEKGIAYLYLHDEAQEMAKAYGATCTPHAFVLNGKRQVAYMGAIDDNQAASKVTQHYVQTALDSILSGASVTKTETRQFGCGIH